MCSKGSSGTCIKVCTRGLLTEIILQAGREILVGQAPTQHEEEHQNLLHRVVQELLSHAPHLGIWQRQEDSTQTEGLPLMSEAEKHSFQPSVAGGLVFVVALIKVLFKRLPKAILSFTCNCPHQKYSCRSLSSFFTGIMPEWDPSTQKAFSPK